MRQLSADSLTWRQKLLVLSIQINSSGRHPILYFVQTPPWCKPAAEMIIIIKTGDSHVSPTCPEFKVLRTNFCRGLVPASMFHYLPLDTVRKMRKVSASSATAPPPRPSARHTHPRSCATRQRHSAQRPRRLGLVDSGGARPTKLDAWFGRDESPAGQDWINAKEMEGFSGRQAYLKSGCRQKAAGT